MKIHPVMSSLGWPLTLVAVLAVQGCGGGSSGGAASVSTYAIGGTVSGLTAGNSLVLQNTNADALTVSTNGAFALGSAIATGGSYGVTVKTQPIGQTCTVASGSGIVAGANITAVAVTCVPASYTIGAAVSGLLPGKSVMLLNNGTDSLTVNANGNVTFTNTVTANGSYAVTVTGQPPGQTCLVSDGAGIAATANVTAVRVLCPSETVLWTFPPSGLYGSGSEASLIQARDGNLYGTTSSDGANSIGTVFKVTTAGVYSALWDFGGTTTDGQEPLAGLVQGSDGKFYGTTFAGGTIGGGTAFSITSAGVETVLWNFGAAGDSNNPTAVLIQGSDGNFYGTTAGGGVNGKGAVFKITPAGAEAVLWSFGSTQADGQVPWGGVIEASDGNLYGTTVSGGANNLGTVYRVTKAGAETVIWNFGSGSDGATPYGPLMQAADGNFYGLTQGGGTAHIGAGFKLTMAGVEAVLWNFDLNTGASPIGGLIQGNDGAFYGTTAVGGLGGGEGTVFRATTAGELLVLWNNFPYSSGPKAGVVQGADGALYGITEGYSGATPGPSGIVFRIAF